MHQLLLGDPDDPDPPLSLSLVRGSHVAVVFEQENPPPPGFRPLPPCTVCPPGGFYFGFTTWLLHWFLNVSQVFTFFRNGDVIFGSVASLCMGLHVFYLFVYASTRCISFMWRSTRYSAARGLPNDVYQSVLAGRAYFEAVGFGLVAPYGMMLNGRLTVFGALTAAGSFLLGVKVLASFDFRNECGGEIEATKIILPWKTTIAQTWSLLRTIFELTWFAVSSAILHPLLVAPFIILQRLVIAFLEMPYTTDLFNDSYLYASFVAILATPTKLHGWSSTMLMPSGGTQTIRIPPAKFHAVFTLTRVLVQVVLVFSLDLPHGLVGFSSLARPMGMQAMNMTNVMHLGDIGSLPFDSNPISLGSCWYRRLFFAICAMAGPLYILGNICMLSCYSAYRNGEKDQALWDASGAKVDEMNSWCDKRAQAHGWNRDPAFSQ